MNDYNRMIALFGYETQGGRTYLWDNPRSFSRQGGQAGKMLDESLAEWKATKRALTEEEILKGEWEKVGDHGPSFKVKFLRGGKFIERAIDKDESWEGTWQFVGIALRTTRKTPNRQTTSEAAVPAGILKRRKQAVPTGNEKPQTTGNKRPIKI